MRKDYIMDIGEHQISMGDTILYINGVPSNKDEGSPGPRLHIVYKHSKGTLRIIIPDGTYIMEAATKSPGWLLLEKLPRGTTLFEDIIYRNRNQCGYNLYCIIGNDIVKVLLLEHPLYMEGHPYTYLLSDWDTDLTPSIGTMIHNDWSYFPIRYLHRQKVI